MEEGIHQAVREQRSGVLEHSTCKGMGAEGLGGIFCSITENSLLQECKAQGKCRVEGRSKAEEVDRLAAEVP